MKIIEGKSKRFTKEMADEVYEDYIKVGLEKAKLCEKEGKTFRLEDVGICTLFSTKKNTLILVIMKENEGKEKLSQYRVIIGATRLHVIFTQLIEKILKQEEGFTRKLDVIDKLHTVINKELERRYKIKEEKS